MWGPIIAAVVAAFVPVFAKRLSQLIDQWFQKSAKKLPEPAGPADIGTLFDRAVADAPKGLRGRMRRVFLRALRGVAMARADAIWAKARGENVTVPSLTERERAEVKDAAAGVSKT